MKSGETELEILASRLRARVAEGRYPEAQQALGEYCREIRATLGGLPPGDPGLRLLQHEWQRLYDETRRRVLAKRAHACERLAQLPKFPRLYGDDPQPRHTWQCSG